MLQRQLAGNRIRERRMSIGIRQQALAQTVGISASYLNLIEHNRRRIGGKLLLQISEALSVDPSYLSEGAEAATVSSLQAAAAANPSVELDPDDAPSLAERFPGWSSLIVEQAERTSRLERLVASYSDRLAHDPQLANSVHDILSVVTAIRATAGILADGDDLDSEWLARFHRNIFEDSVRLADSAQALVAYLGDTETVSGEDRPAMLPQEAFDHWIEERDYRLEELENSTSADVVEELRNEGRSDADNDLIFRFAKRYEKDAKALPLSVLLPLLESQDTLDPLAISTATGVTLSTVFRRLVALPRAVRPEVGLVEVDIAGAITFQRPMDGFALPRFGSGCAYWPVFQALQRPQVPIRRVLRSSGNRLGRYLTYSIAEPSGPLGLDTPPLFSASMLILRSSAESADEPVLEVGSSCRICPVPDCLGRREGSVFGSGAREF